MSSFGNYILGTFEPLPNDTMGLVSPADTQLSMGTYPCDPSAVERAIDAAQNAKIAWRRTSPEARAVILKKYQQALIHHADAIATCIALEVGKPLWEAKAEVNAMIGKVDVTLTGQGSTWTQPQILPTIPGEIRFRPLGVVGIIGPFNLPGHLPNGQIIPALAMGNAVVFKPSEKTPGSGAWIAQCLHEAGLPAGVLNLVHGGAEVGQQLAQHQGLDGLSFTGSVKVGQQLAQLSAVFPHRMLALELGGKNASIILDDADLESACRAVVFSAFATAGQRCTATSRLIVTKSIADKVLPRICELAASLRIGFPLEPDVFMGPVISEQSRSHMLALLAKAEAHGFVPQLQSTALTIPNRPGWYMGPAIYLSPDNSLRIVELETEERFAPALVVYIADSESHAIDLANASPFGLSCAVFTQDQSRFVAMADHLEVGVLHWNEPTAGASGKLPFGGTKQSGNHRPAGSMTSLYFSDPQAILLQNKTNSLSWPGFPT